MDERQEIFRREIGKRRDLNLVANPNLTFREAALCAASICSAIRLFVCFVLSRISSPFQTNLYHHRLILLFENHNACLAYTFGGTFSNLPHYLERFFRNVQYCVHL